MNRLDLSGVIYFAMELNELLMELDIEPLRY